MRSLTVIAVMSLLALFPIGMSATGGPADSLSSPNVTLELVLSNSSADQLGVEMQQLIDAIRIRLDLTIDSAPSAGISIEPQVSDQGVMTGYVATNRLMFLREPTDQPATLSQSHSVASQFTGADVFMMTSPAARQMTNNWDTQWLECG